MDCTHNLTFNAMMDGVMTLALFVSAFAAVSAIAHLPMETFCIEGFIHVHIRPVNILDISAVVLGQTHECLNEVSTVE